MSSKFKSVSDFGFDIPQPGRARADFFPVGFVHVDLDGLWTLAAGYGFPERESFDSDVVFESGLPRLLELFDELALRATFFIVGRDLEQPAKARAVAAIAEAGHELANHSFSHRFDLEQMTDAELKREFTGTSDAIEALCERRPIGVRAPGYAAGPRVLAACARAGLRYDGSSLPTRWGPALRWLAGRLRAGVGRELGDQARPVPGAAGQYGAAAGERLAWGASDPLAPCWHQPEATGQRMLRLPLAVSPVLRLPLHASLGMMLGEGRTRVGLRRLAGRGEPISFLLHGMDAVGAEDLQGRLPGALAARRAFRVPLASKLRFVRATLGDLKRVTEVRRTCDWIRETHPDLFDE